MALSVAFIGLKGHQYVALETIPGIPGVEVVAASDDSPATLRAVPSFPGATSRTKAYLDWRELLANHSPDIVVEAGTDRDRADVLVACAERGIHFLCEKPVAQDLGGLERVDRAVSQAGVTASCLLTMRAEPPYIAMRHAVRSGLVGVITQVGGQKSYRLGERPPWQKSRETFSGIIPFIGIHVMDLSRWITGREFAEVMAYASNVGHPEMGALEDNACVIARLDNGASAAFRLDYCRPAAAPTHGDDQLRIIGSRGVIEVREGLVTAITRDEGPHNIALPRPVNLFADLVGAIRRKRQPYIPFAEAVGITNVALRARESAEAGRPVKLTGSA
ncbi:MAG: Gfo/Idh/MocA family protein [Armatimonadota bacterium]